MTLSRVLRKANAVFNSIVNAFIFVVKRKEMERVSIIYASLHHLITIKIISKPSSKSIDPHFRSGLQTNYAAAASAFFASFAALRLAAFSSRSFVAKSTLVCNSAFNASYSGVPC
jgi:hypothetical protein